MRLHICPARIETLRKLEMTRITVSDLNCGWRAGQHVRVRIIGSGTEWKMICKDYPSVIAAMEGDGLVLVFKDRGIYSLAEARQADDDARKAEGEHEVEDSRRKIVLALEGPYGNLG